MGKFSRDKGARYERKIVNLLREIILMQLVFLYLVVLVVILPGMLIFEYLEKKLEQKLKPERTVQASPPSTNG